MRMFDLEFSKSVTFGILCVSYVVYLLTSSISLCIFTAVVIFGAHSAHVQQSSTLGLNSQQNHAANTRRKAIPNSEKNIPRDSFNSNLHQMTRVRQWGISKSNYSIPKYSVGSSPLSLQHNSPKNASRTTCGFASQVVSTAYNHPPIDQSHYRGLGLFPTIHLQKSPLPILSEKNSTMIHNPVTVRIAPPEKNMANNSRTDFKFNSKVQTSIPTSSVNSVLKSLQQSHRKRTFYNANVESDESQMKRQRRENSPINNSAFKNLSSSLENESVLNGMRHSTPTTTSYFVTGISRENSPIVAHKTDARTSSCKNNEIFSSYSSMSRSRETMKRRRSERSGSPSIKISKLRSSKNSVFNKPAIEERRSSIIETKSIDMTTPEKEQNNSDKEENSRKIPKLSVEVPERRMGYSKKRELSLYQTLRQKNSLLAPQSVPQANSTLEDDQRDQAINQARLHKLLTAFQAKEDNSNTGSCSLNIFNSRPLQVSLGTETNISRSPVSSSGLLSIATIPLSEPVSIPSVTSWLPRLDVTTTTTSLTTLSSTGSERQEVEKIHVPSTILSPTTSGSPILSALPITCNLQSLQSNIAVTSNSFLDKAVNASTASSKSPLVTSSFVSMPLTTNSSPFNFFPTNPVTASLALPAPEKSLFLSPSLLPMEPKVTTASIATTTSNSLVLGALAAKNLELSAMPTFGQLQTSNNKSETGANNQPFQFAMIPQSTSSTLQPEAFKLPEPIRQTFNTFNTETNMQSTPPMTTTGGFTFNFGGMTTTSTSMPSSSVFSVNTCFGQTVTSSTPAFNSGVFSFGTTPQVNGPATIPNFSTTAAVTTPASVPAAGLGSQFNFGQSEGGFNFNFTPESSSGVSNRKAIQARRRTSRQH